MPVIHKSTGLKWWVCLPSINMAYARESQLLQHQYISYLRIRACMSAFIASWLRTTAQLGIGRSFHFLYNSVTRKYRAFRTASSFGNEPFLVTFRKLEFIASIAFVVYMTFRTALPKLNSCSTCDQFLIHTSTAPGYWLQACLNRSNSACAAFKLAAP